MDNSKWLAKKYPDSSVIISECFDDNRIGVIKKEKMKIGRLKNDISVDSVKYDTGSMVAWKRYKVYEYERMVGYDIHCITRNQDGQYVKIPVNSFDLDEITS